MSMVPSRSVLTKGQLGMARPKKLVIVPTSAKDIDCMPEGKEPS